MSMELFCLENTLPIGRVDKYILDEFLSLQTVAEVIRSSLFDKKSKHSLIKLFKSVKISNKDMYWLVCSTSISLLKTRHSRSKNPFDKCPLYLMHFLVTPSGRVKFQIKLSPLHQIH